VIVQPSLYGTDNRLLLDALVAFGPEARGVAVIDLAIGDAELRAMDAKGVRGVRFNLSSPNGTPVEAMQAVAARLASFGWHIQVVAKPDRIVEHANLFGSLPVPIVFDHLAQIDAPGTEHPAFHVVSNLLRQQKAWVKISGFYTFGKGGPPAYPDAAALVHGYLNIAPDRLVWGTDWPHPTLDENSKPDDSQLVDLIAGWLGTDKVRRQVFATNPAKLYAFA
jgi:predicted TIM-barrel fold metal-dependent hydrolase